MKRFIIGLIVVILLLFLFSKCVETTYESYGGTVNMELYDN